MSSKLNISIRAKLWGGMALFFIFFMLIWYLTFNTSDKIIGYLDSSKVEIMKQSDRLRQSLQDAEQLISDAAQLGDKDILGDADEKADEFRKALAHLKALDGDRVVEYDLTEQRFDLYYNNARQAAQIIINGGSFDGEIVSHAEQVGRTLPALREDVGQILTRNYDSFSALLNQATGLSSRLIKGNSVLLLILFFISMIFAPLIIRSITKPIGRLVRATREVADGNLDAKAQVTAHDEIGKLAEAFNDMTEKLKEKSAALEKTTKDLKLANIDLKEADRLKSHFLASMSHELRTPLNAIINFSEQIIEDWDMLARDKERSAEANDMIKRVSKSSKQLLALINELLDLAKLESGHMRLNLDSGDLKEVIDDAVASVAPLVENGDVTLSYTIDIDLPQFVFDERKVLQMLINLLSNAIKFTRAGQVTIAVEQADDYPEGVLIKVIDTGIGIEPRHQSIIFDRFRQADGADSRNYAGTGLGLNLVKDLIELHGGKIEVQSKKGEGSVFTLYLPYQAVEKEGEP